MLEISSDITTIICITTVISSDITTIIWITTVNNIITDVERSWLHTELYVNDKFGLDDMLGAVNLLCD